jgi:uncharacterized SAM-binding protein YcdF (DUF218 family)
MRPKFKKILALTAASLGLLAVLDFGLVFGFGLREPQVRPAQAVVVLGAGIYSPALYYRSLKGLELYEQDIVPLIALTGGRVSDKDISEAAYSEKVLQKNAKGNLNLVSEDTSKNTYENLRNIKRKLPETDNIIIVTDRFHIARSYFTARAVGFRQVGFASPENRYSAGELAYHYVREMAAMVSYVPVFMGLER